MKTNRKTHHCWVISHHWLSATFAMLLAISFAASVAIDGSNVLAQSRRKPTRSSGQAKSRPSEPQLRSYGFDTVTVDSKGKIIDRRKGQARYYVEDINGVGLAMVEIPAGSFTMGSSEDKNEKPIHRVNVSLFYLGKYEVTQAQWHAAAKLAKVNRDFDSGRSFFKGDDLPVQAVSWEDAMEFCARLSKATGRVYRLPTEAEWEYGCRAGSTKAFAFGDSVTPELVNYDGSFPYASAPKGLNRGETTPVGSLGAANEFGLYDMHGNVLEWCLDYWHDSYDGAPTDGSAWQTGGDNRQRRVMRGGSFAGLAPYASQCRSAARYHYPQDAKSDDSGFRLVGVAGTPSIRSGRAKSPAVGATQGDRRKGTAR